MSGSFSERPIGPPAETYAGAAADTTADAPIAAETSRTARPRRFALREASGWTRSASLIAVEIAIGGAVAWLRPYGTRDFAAAERFAFWMLVIPIIGQLVGPTIRRIARSRRASAWPPAVQALAGTLLASIPSTVVAVGLQAAFGHPPSTSAAELLGNYASVTTMIALISIPMTLIYRHGATASGEGAPLPALASQEPAGGSPFLRRIPSKLGRELLSIATEDHYLRVTTDRGSDLILFRLSDAVGELDPALGQQVHRSYWVARRAVAAVERDGHRTRLVLTNGERIPVSRTYHGQLRRAGWLDA